MDRRTLSTVAQAIWDAFNDAYEVQGPLEDMGQPIAAALRAAAGLEVSSSFDGTLYETGEDEFRAFLHYIAAELEGAS